MLTEPLQAFSGACKNAYPQHLRLSIHQSVGEHKVSMSLLNTRTGYTTPWHCSVALMADGEWISAPMGDFQKDPRFEVVHENGRPSYFFETSNETGSNPSVKIERQSQGSLPLNSIPKATATATKPSMIKNIPRKKNIESQNYINNRSREKGFTFMITGFLLNLIVAALASILFYTLSSTTSAFKDRSSWLFAVVLLAALSTALEARIVRRLSGIQ